MILLLIFFTSNLHGQKTDVIIHVDDGYKPFSYKENDQAKGIYVKILKAAFLQMKNFNVKIVPIPWNRGKKMMKEGDGFGLAPAFFHAHDWFYLYPYSLPFYTETIVAVCTKAVLKQKRANWPQDYQGLTIGNVAGFDGWGGKLFRTFVKEGKIKYRTSNSSEALIKMLTRKRHDCIMMEKLAFEIEIKRLEKVGVYDPSIHEKLLIGAVIGTDPVYIGYSETAIKNDKYPYANKFQKDFDVIMYKMLKNGEVKRIMDNYSQ